MRFVGSRCEKFDSGFGADAVGEDTKQHSRHDGHSDGRVAHVAHLMLNVDEAEDYGR